MLGPGGARDGAAIRDLGGLRLEGSGCNVEGWMYDISRAEEALGGLYQAGETAEKGDGRVAGGRGRAERPEGRRTEME